jgi:hypothetical protein
LNVLRRNGNRWSVGEDVKVRREPRESVEQSRAGQAVLHRRIGEPDLVSRVAVRILIHQELKAGQLKYLLQIDLDPLCRKVAAVPAGEVNAIESIGFCRRKTLCEYEIAIKF